MKTLKELNFNEDQKELVTSMINRYGTGDHPYCTNMSFDFFTVKYLEEIILNNFDEMKKNLTKKGEELFYQILDLF
jgi:hypothetical protein